MPKEVRPERRSRRTGKEPSNGTASSLAASMGGSSSKGGSSSGASSSSGSVLSSWLFFWSAALMTFSIVQLRSPSTANLAAPASTTMTTSSRVAELGEGYEGYGDYSARVNDFSMEIFSAPKPFVGEDKENNIRAIRSWLSLKPQPRVTLLGFETGYDEAAKEFGINIEKRVDKNFLGVPLFNSMVMRANNSKALVTVIINGDILLFDDFIQTLHKVISNFRDFLIVAARYDIDALPSDVKEGDANYLRRVREHVLSTGTLHTYGGMDVWAWNTDGPRLFDPVMPHFVFGRGKYDNWLTHETITAGRRQVIDVSETCLTVHVKHDYHLVAGNDAAAGKRRLLGQFWSEGKKSKFELFINIFLSLNVGSYTNQMGNVLFAPWKLSLCLEPSGMCLLKRKRPGICNCEFSSFVSKTQTDPVVKNGSRVIRCGMISVETKDDFTIPVLPPEGSSEPPPFGLPLTLESVLERQAQDNTIILTALNFGYRFIMMNWVCNMRHLNIYNYVVAALDPDLYKYAYTRGLASYYETTIFEGLNSSLLADATYGSDSFKQLTKMKSRVVLRLLKLGVNVVWTDCDIIWFKNPLEHMKSHQADLIIQTNAPDDEPMNGKRRINSGFYLARSNPPTIQAFEDIIKFAARSRMSEQPCFYDVMCGKNSETAIGDNRCAYNGMTVELLDRHLYPNGITDKIWETDPGQIPYKFPHLYILHNNWVKGADGKQERFEKHGFILFDQNDELCMYPTNW
ncbi:Beta-arabinofuranosyltransferase RAY1 [Porphyridium purpureum]|uniref:Beta-arabinofuranosyltransferase RAY1 n=1 Tax=Porphyridium purpureum TaxID=35688 RepID=A0A5J4YWR2_PORPP|nr:Beta-arabinofuranosyltransferase RAY1 [Porphyridium purpureum]|eukprot:POR2060..scf227_4